VARPPGAPRNATPRRKNVEVKDIVNLAGVAVVDAQNDGY
jgi:hypothetical protein